MFELVGLRRMNDDDGEPKTDAAEGGLLRAAAVEKGDVDPANAANPPVLDTCTCYTSIQKFSV